MPLLLFGLASSPTERFLCKILYYHVIISNMALFITTEAPLLYAGMVIGKNICLTPSDFTIGNMIPYALEINLTPSIRRLGEGNGSNSRPTPYKATAKKCATKLIGLGFKPDSSAIGPCEYIPPRLK